MSEQDDRERADQALLTLAALADGEQVDPGDLRDALADPAARDYLVDLITLRQAVDKMSAATEPPWHRRRPLRTRVGWLAAAAVVVMSVASGYLAGQRNGARMLPAPAIETFVDVGSAAVAPPPTHVVPLRPGVDWTETTGGK
jgi:negative regulator of sigma E activity